MEDFWKAALKVGGPVAIVGFLIWTILNYLFKQNIIDIFETEQKFTLVIMIITGLMICMLAAIVKFKHPNGTPQGPNQNKATFKKTTISGDVVLGDKTINQKDSNE